MDTNRPAPLDLAARARTTRRLNQLTAGVALAGTVGVLGFGGLAAIGSARTTGSTTPVTTTTTADTSTSTSGTTSTTPPLGGGVAPQPATGAGHTTTGGS